MYVVPNATGKIAPVKEKEVGIVAERSNSAFSDVLYQGETAKEEASAP
jgi:hypothetical protein